jgi:hypothetical protein
MNARIIAAKRDELVIRLAMMSRGARAIERGFGVNIWWTEGATQELKETLFGRCWGIVSENRNRVKGGMERWWK